MKEKTQAPTTTESPPGADTLIRRRLDVQPKSLTRERLRPVHERGHNPTIMLALPDDDFRGNVEGILDRQGYVVHTVENSDDTVQQARALNPDVLVIKQDLPPDGGTNTIETLKQAGVDTNTVLIWDKRETFIKKT